MIRTLSLKNRSYLAVTTITSTGVLSGIEYCIPLLIVLLIIPIVNLVIKKLTEKYEQHSIKIYCHEGKSCR